MIKASAIDTRLQNLKPCLNSSLGALFSAQTTRGTKLAKILFDIYFIFVAYCLVFVTFSLLDRLGANGFMFCDAGIMDFWISVEDLKAQRLDRVYGATAGG